MAVDDPWYPGKKIVDARARKQHQYELDTLRVQNQYNSEQAQQAYYRQLAAYDYQFDKEAEFNSPFAQMQRYQAAGLNPYLITGNITNGSINASMSSAPQASSGSGGTSVDLAGSANGTLNALANIANASQSLAQLGSSIDLNKSSAAKNYAEAKKTAGVDTENTIADTELKRADTSLRASQKENIAADTRRLNYMVDKFLPKQADEIQKRIEDLGSQIWQRQQVTPAEVAKLRQEIAESITRANLNDATRAKVNKELQWFDDQVTAALKISDQTFQQMLSNNSVLKIRNQISQDVLNTSDVNGLWNDEQFRNNIYKLRALQFLTPSPGLDSYSEGAGLLESLGRGYNLFFGGKSGSSSIKGFLK